MNVLTSPEKYYLDKISDILYHKTSNEASGSPTQLLDFLFMGNYRDADNYANLQRLGITHVMNCAAYRQSKDSPYPAEVGIIGYDQFHANDSDTYDILQHFARAKAFIDDARKKGGKVLVHCAMGVNRSGAICAAYMMVDQNMDLLEVMRTMKQKRGMCVCNRGFQRQLIKFARMRGLLKPHD